MSLNRKTNRPTTRGRAGLVARLRPLREARGGNVALLAAFAMLPMAGVMGIAMDYGTALANKAKLETAADAAAITAITTAKTVYTSEVGQYGKSQAASDAIAQGQAAGLKAFAGNVGALVNASVPIPTISVSKTNQTFTATVSYSTSMTNNFGKLLGKASTPLVATTSSTLSMPTYINYYIIVDTSQSMGIGSTASDMQALYNRVVAYGNGSGGEAGCVFACHVKTGTQTYTNEYLAHSILPRITLRIDAAASAIQTILQQAVISEAAQAQSTVKIGLYTMQQDPSTGVTLNTLASPEGTPFPHVTAANALLELGNNNANGIGDSNFAASIAAFAGNLTAQGDGSTAAQALNYVFLITDGVQDTPGSSCTSGHCVQALNSSICTQLQNKATVGVIYTTYNPIYANNNQSSGYQVNYSALVAPIISQVVPNLKSCASQPTASYYFEATDGPAITTGMQKLFAPTIQQARLLQ